MEGAQEVKLFPQWSGEGQKSVMSMNSDIYNICTWVTGCASRAPRLPDQETTGSGDENAWQPYFIRTSAHSACS